MIWGSGRQVSVDSVAYNLAGAEENRPDYLKSMVVGNVLSGTRDSISQTLQKGYLNGPVSKMKQFYRWAEKPENYGLIGMPDSELKQMGVVSSLVAQEGFARLNGYAPWVQRAQIGGADVALFAEQYMLEYQPTYMDGGWTANGMPDGTISITPTLGFGWSFTPADFDPTANYVYIWYNALVGGTVSGVTTGSWNALGTAAFPDTSSWALEGTTGSGGVTTTIYSKMTYTGSGFYGPVYLRETRYDEETALPLDRRYRIDSQTYDGVDYNQGKMFIYKLGSGDPGLDALIVNPPDLGSFFPYIPARIDNQFLSSTYLSSEYEQAKKAYKKATGSKFDDLIDKIADNPSLGDIDHAYVVFGVSLNVLENASRRYLFNFFDRLRSSQVGGPSIYSAWKSALTAQQGVYDTWLNWREGQIAGPEDGRFGTPEPPRPVLPQIPGNEVRISGTGGSVATHYDVRLTWLYITSTSGSGLGKPGAKRGDVWFEVRPPDEVFFSVFGGGALSNITVDGTVNTVRVYYQETASTYRYLDLVGMEHHNYVYGYRRVTITAQAAIEDTDESGFVVPLHYGIWDEMSLVQGTQMATASVFLIFNCYKIVKAKWYQKGVFQILIVVAIAILSVVFTGGAGIGLLGAHMAVGAAFGLTGIAAAIAGSILNALAAMILSTLLSKLGTGIFGEQFGAIFSAILMFVVGGGINFDTGAMVINWGDLLKVENLLKIGSVLGETYAGHLNAQTQELGAKLTDYKDNAKAESEKIQQAFMADFGYGAGQIDPMMFVDVASSSRILAESSDTFLTRTLMTGTEVAELSQDLLSNFVEYSTKLPDAYV